MDDKEERQPESLLPYDEWAEEAQRLVVVRALQRVAEAGLPGDHHFFLTFRTGHPGVVVPSRLRAQYPQEMTIVLQHQFWDLRVDEAHGAFSVGLSFGGVPSTLTVPFAALAGFADPQVRFGLRFRPAEPAAQPEPPAPEPPPTAVVPGSEASAAPQVVSLEAFRRRPTPKE
ncbi:MAG: hypothetical protein JO209_11120 [Acidisphaera sp.]|nr:hypothetical protein [Acidisphaera sp.]